MVHVVHLLRDVLHDQLDHQLEARAELVLQVLLGAKSAKLAVHAHSWPVHQAAIHDDVPMLQLLVDRGARLDVVDTLWNGTPLGWAVHEKKRNAEAFLRAAGAK